MQALSMVRLLICWVGVASMSVIASEKPAGKWSLLIHGGAGVIARGDLTTQQERAYREALQRALQAGAEVLERNGSALDAVEAAVQVMEDDPLFNAGRGAVFTAAGRNELDAAIMDGRTRSAGAVAAVTRTRHPISLARRVMQKSAHVMLVGEGADAFSQEQGLEQVDPAWFFTPRRWSSLERYLHENNLAVPRKPSGVQAEARAELAHDEGRYGTVGAVAMDRAGHLAAATSTGGTTGKRWGRVGDSPIIGAGTYANQLCAVSATGTGEYFIRLTVAREVCALLEYKGWSLQRAADEMIQRQLPALGGDGGLIAVSSRGEQVWSFNTPGMYRARVREGGTAQIEIFNE